MKITRTFIQDPALTRNHRVHAVHAHLLASSGDREGAVNFFARAASLTTNAPEQRHLLGLVAQQAPLPTT